MSNHPQTNQQRTIDYTARARQYIHMLRLPAKMNGRYVCLTDYPDQETLTFLQPGTTLADHRQLTTALAEQLRERGATVDFITLELPAYQNWLTEFELTDCPGNRAQYVSWISAADPKPQPIQPAQA